MTETERPAKNQISSSFGEPNATDPTPGWIPFVFVIAIAIVFLIGFVFVALLVR